MKTYIYLYRSITYIFVKIRFEKQYNFVCIIIRRANNARFQAVKHIKAQYYIYITMCNANFSYLDTNDRINTMSNKLLWVYYLMPVYAY